MAAMVKAARAKVSEVCRIMGPETFGWGQKEYNTRLASMADAVENIDVWGNHLYGSNDWSYISTVTKKTGKPMWMTEFLIDYDTKTYKGEFSAEYDMIKSIEQAMASGYNAYVYYNMLNDFFACNHGGKDTELWKRAYVFGHYAKYATGRTRVKTTLSNTAGALIGGSGYATESGDTVSVFVLNTSPYTYRLTTALAFAPDKVVQVTTSETDNRVVKDVTEQYATGTTLLKLMLDPGVFYTFQFIKLPEVPDGIEDVPSSECVEGACRQIYSANGAAMPSIQRGVNIISDGKTKRAVKVLGK